MMQSDFYHVLLFYARGKPVPTIFATQDEDLHRTLRKPIATMYGMSQVLSFESQVNFTMDYFFKHLDDLFTDQDVVCNLSFWLQAFAFDLIGEITFSRPIGFLEKGEDIEGIMASIWRYFTAASPVSSLSSGWTLHSCFRSILSTSDMQHSSPKIEVLDRRCRPRHWKSSMSHIY